MFYRPLFYLYYYANYQLWGANAHGHFAVYWAIHIVNAVLFFFMLRSLTVSKRASYLASLIFVVHPLCTGSAMLIFGGDALGVLFFLLGITLFARFAGNGGPVYYIPALLCAALAILSKEMFVTFPLIAILAILLISRKGERKINTGRLALFTIPFFVVVWGIFLWRCLLLGGLGTYEPYNIAFGSRLAELTFAMRNFIHKGPGLLLYRKWQIIDVGEMWAWCFFALLILGVASSFRRVVREKARYLIFGALWTAITVIPVLASSKEVISPFNLYLPLGGVCVMLSLFFEPRGKGAGAAYFGVLSLLLLAFLFVVSFVTSGIIHRNGEKRAQFYSDIAAHARSNPTDESRIYCIYKQSDDPPTHEHLPYLDLVIKCMQKDVSLSDTFVANLAATSSNSSLVLTPNGGPAKTGPFRENLLFNNVIFPLCPKPFNDARIRLLTFDGPAEAAAYPGVRILVYRSSRKILDVTHNLLERAKRRNEAQRGKELVAWKMSDRTALSKWLDANERPGYGITEVRGRGGVLYFASNGSNQYLRTPEFFLNPTDAGYVEIRMRVTNRMGISAGLGKIVWSSIGDDYDDSFKGVKFSVKTDGLFHTYKIPLNSFYWIMSGPVRQMGVSAAQFEYEAEIDHFKIVTGAPSP
jgi:hypothetical protein